MALFRTTHNDDLIQNWFWELPDHYWIGTMLVNKHTMMPVGGYDTPLAQFAVLPPRPLWWGYDSGTWGNADFFTESRGGSYGPMEYYTTFWSNTYNYGLYDRPFAISTCLGQCGFMGIGEFPVRYVADSNNPDEFPTGYVRDPSDENIIYAHITGSSVGESGYLVKYDTRTHKVLWSKRNFGSLAFARMQIFAIEGNYLFILGNVANPAGHGKKLFDRAQYGTSGAGTVHLYVNQDIIPYHIAAGWYIAKVHKDTGEFDNIVDVFQPIFNLGDGGSCQYLGQVEDGKDLFLVFGTTSNLSFVIEQVARAAFYEYWYRGSHYGEWIPNRLLYFGQKTNANGGFSHDYQFDFLGYETRNSANAASAFQNAIMTQNIKFIKYDRTTNALIPVPGEELTLPTKWAAPADNFYHSELYNNPSYYFTSQPSRPDRTITGATVCYGHWGKLLKADELPTGAVPTDARSIWKHIYQGGVQSHSQMTVLNKDGFEMTMDDWVDNKNAHSAKFYVLYGENNNKFLMVHDSYLFSSSGVPYDTSDIYATTYIFKFVDDNTLQLVDQINLNCTDLLWIKHNWFVAARRNRIRLYSIDLETGKIKIERNITTKTGDNYFSYVYVDDMRNLWFSEVGKDLLQTTHLSTSLYFINSYTISKLSMEPEKFLYTYNGSNIDTYLKIAAVGDFNELIERTVRLTAIGPMVFKDNGAKALTTTTAAGGYKNVDVTLTGVGEINVTMTLA